MKKRIIIITCICVLLLVTLIYTSYGKVNKEFSQDGTLYAVTVNGEVADTFPAKGMYRVDVTCNGATGKWDYDAWKLYIENGTNGATCNIEFTSISKTLFSDYIISLENRFQGDGAVLYENGYRYSGENPNNYVLFNNELWRIIGVFDETSHGRTGENLVKLIKPTSIGGLVWNTTEAANWSTSSLMNLLNGAYLNSTDGTNNAYCYTYYSTGKGKCDYRYSGINATARDMIVPVTWYLGGANDVAITTEQMYNFERGTAHYGSYPTTVTNQKVGLMYASDYGYASFYQACSRDTLLNYYTGNCEVNNWLYGQVYEWTLTPYTPIANGVYIVYVNGPIYYEEGVNMGYTVRPVVYLDASVYVLDGTGSETDPYIIAK